MNLSTLKALTWIAALGTGGALGYEVFDFLKRKPILEGFVTKEEQQEVLRGFETPEEPRRNLVDYNDVKLSFLDMDWTGRVIKVVAPPKTGGDKPPKPPKTPMSKLLTVLAVQVDISNSKGSLAFVKFQAGLSVHNEITEQRILRIDERLPKPHEYARISEIISTGVRFTFDEEGRESELVEASDYTSDYAGIVKVDQAVQPAGSSRIFVNQNAAPYRPAKTVAVRKNEFQIGTETAAEVDRNFSSILSRDLSYRTARDPRTGQVTGIQITRVAAGSIPANHGVSSGEIVKSINGYKVTSVSDAVSYVKKESATTNEWTVVFEKQGKDITRVYRSPE
jgi:hypothetical protein